MPDKAHSDSAKDPGLVKARPAHQFGAQGPTSQPATLLPFESAWYAAPDPARLTPAGVLTLQRMAGNGAVEWLLARPAVQRSSLTVGAAHDAYEQEADRVAEQVLSMPDRPGPAAQGGAAQHGLQRQEDEEEIQAMPLAAGISRVQREAAEEAEPVQALRIQRQEDEEEVQAKRVQRQEEEEEPVQTMRVQREEDEEEVQAKRIQRQEEEEEPVQAMRVQREEDEEPVQAKRVQRQEDEEEVQAKRIQRQEDEEEVQAKRVQREEDEEEVQAKRIQRQEEDEESVQAKPVDPLGSFQTTGHWQQRLEASRGGGSPLPCDVRAYMEPRFGADFSAVRVHAGGEAGQLNREISAQAFTNGQDIYLGEGRFDPGTTGGNRLLAHELTHVVQQGAASEPEIRRWSVRTVWGLGSPAGHELLTEEAVKRINAKRKEQNLGQFNELEIEQIVKGARWNDLLGHSAGVFGLMLKTGLGGKNTMVHQSHEGSWQFLHAMASKNMEEAIQTQHRIMLWAKFCYFVYTGQGDVFPSTRLTAVNCSVPRDIGSLYTIHQLFSNYNDKKHTVSWLFTEEQNHPNTKERALGSMLHMLQDSFCAAHCERVAVKREGERFARVKSFHSYPQQQGGLHGRHSVADMIAGKQGDDPAKRIRRTAGAEQAVDVSAKVLSFARRGKAWDEGPSAFLEKALGLVEPVPVEALNQQGLQPVEGVGRAFNPKAGRQFKRAIADRFEKWLPSLGRTHHETPDLNALRRRVNIYSEGLVYDPTLINLRKVRAKLLGDARQMTAILVLSDRVADQYPREGWKTKVNNAIVNLKADIREDQEEVKQQLGEIRDTLAANLQARTQAAQAAQAQAAQAAAH